MVVALLEPSSAAVRRRWQRPLLLGLAAVVAVLVVVFGLRMYHSYQLLRSAQDLRSSEVAPVRAWMTLHYVAHTYGVPEDALVERLGLPPEVDRQASLRALASDHGRRTPDYVQLVQRTVAELRVATPARGGGGGP
jgi:hypothetical protein